MKKINSKLSKKEEKMLDKHIVDGYNKRVLFEPPV